MTIDKQSLREAAHDSGNILLIVAARMARRELFTPLHYVSELPQKVVSMRVLREALERSEETLQREVCKIVDGHNRMKMKLTEAEERITELESIRTAAEKLVRCKGRYHGEQNYRALAALFGVNTPDLPLPEHENVHYADAAEMEIVALRNRIAELEARTVRLPREYICYHGGPEGEDFRERCYLKDSILQMLAVAGMQCEVV
ncbi:ead/Ea22-like family protein [Enterobacteriaceae bacterium 4M9]|nr:ead/Ea22-like family protein [Enterobacteriaceae bacterium 4M9]